jgi:4-carboxymuconolactone decarboxylase
VPRIPLPTPETMTPEQRKLRDIMVAGPRGDLRGPFLAALHRPELADKWQQLGEILRYRTSLPPALNELAILVTGRHCNCLYEWYAHEQMALNAGLAPAIIAAVKARRRPMADDDAMSIYDFADELNRRNAVSGPVYQRALKRWGVVGVVELTALVGYYTMVAMTLNAHQMPLPEGVQPPFPGPEA